MSTKSSYTTNQWADFEDGQRALRDMPVLPRCKVELPGIGRCEVLGEHTKTDSLGRLVHIHGPMSWNGGSCIEVSDDALREAARCLGEALCPNSECRAAGCILEDK